MSKSSRRPNREEIKAKRKEHKKAQKQLRQDEITNGLHAVSHATISNHTCEYSSVEQECRVRNETVAEQMKIFRAKLAISINGATECRNLNG